MYGYVKNNSLAYIDPWGLYIIVINDCKEGDLSKGVEKWTPDILYTADMIILDDNRKEIDRAENVASTFPNSTNGAIPLNTGTYHYTNRYGHHKGKDLGLNLVTPENIDKGWKKHRTVDGGKQFRNIHSGDRPDNRGSEGCITIRPDQWHNFTNYFFVFGKGGPTIGGQEYLLNEGTIELHRDKECKKQCDSNP
mgnify:CR=1 FL=1